MPRACQRPLEQGFANQIRRRLPVVVDKWPQAGAIKVFTDVRSGRNMDRPGLKELLAYARRGDTLAVVRLDRLGRSLG